MNTHARDAVAPKTPAPRAARHRHGLGSAAAATAVVVIGLAAYVGAAAPPVDTHPGPPPSVPWQQSQPYCAPSIGCTGH